MNDKASNSAIDVEGWEQVSPLVRKRVTQGANMTVSHYEFGPDSEFPPHKHVQEQLTMVVRGDVTMTVGGEPKRLGPGEWIYISADVPHSGMVGTEGAVVVGIVSPPRADNSEIEFLDES